MLQQVRRYTRALATAVVTTLSVTILATCVLTPDGHGQRARCEEARHDCGSALRAACCVGSEWHEPSLAAVAPVEAPAPTTVAVDATAAGDRPGASARAAWRLDHWSSGPPGVPTYLFVASFRI